MITSHFTGNSFQIDFSFLSHQCIGKILNASPSLFPAIKGGNVRQQSLQTGFKVTGCTVHFVLVGVLLPNSEEVMKRNLPFFPFLKAEAGWGNKTVYRSWECYQVQHVGVPLHLERQLYTVWGDPLQALPLHHILLALFQSSDPLICGFLRSCLLPSFYGLFSQFLLPSANCPLNLLAHVSLPTLPPNVMYAPLMEVAL